MNSVRIFSSGSLDLWIPGSQENCKIAKGPCRVERGCRALDAQTHRDVLLFGGVELYFQSSDGAIVIS